MANIAPQQAWLRCGGIAGIVFVAGNLAAALLPGAPPKPDAPIADLRAYYVDHRVAVQIGLYCSGIGMVAGLWFIAALRTLLRGVDANGLFASVSYAAGIATSTIALAGAIPVAAAALDPHRDDAVLRALVDFGNMGFALLYFPWALFNGAASLAILRTGLFPRWLGLLGLLVAALFLLAAAGIGTTSGPLAAGGAVSFAALALGMLWGLGISVAMLRSRAAPRFQAQPATA